MDKQRCKVPEAIQEILASAIQRFRLTGEASQLLIARTSAVEDVVRRLFYQASAELLATPMALVATGGFGRQELFPCSDVDVLILVGSRPSGALNRAVGTFVASAWDSGLRLSHSVRTPAECSAFDPQNGEFSISLLDRRFLAGSEDLFEELERQLRKLLRAHRDTLISRLARLTHERYQRFQHTIQHLEPDVKLGPGGIRDLHVLRWMALLEGQIERWMELQARFAPGWQLLAQLRCFLHLEKQRDYNRLSFDLQDALVNQPFSAGRTATEWLRDYYQVAEQISNELQRVLTIWEARRSPIFDAFRSWRSRPRSVEFTTVGGQVYIRNPSHLVDSPDTVLRLFEFIGRHGLALAPETENVVQRVRPFLEERLRMQDAQWMVLNAICGTPHAALALRAMAKCGMLQVFIPEWSRIRWLPLRDFFHRYTVDEHILRSIERLDQLARSPEQAEQTFAELLEEVARPATLKFALLLHDLGKGFDTEDHVRTSTLLAEEICDRLRVPLPDRKRVLFLVAHHLRLAQAISTSDLDDPEVVKELAQLVGTPELLKDLVLVTWADISAVNPYAMTAWRRQQLWRLYLRIYRQLLHGIQEPATQIASIRDPRLARFLEGLPERYWRLFAQEDIDRHWALALRAESEGAAIQLSRTEALYELTAVARDRPKAILSLTSVLTAWRMNILKLDSFQNAEGWSVHRVVFEDSEGWLRLNPDQFEPLLEALRRALVEGTEQVLEARQRRPFPSPKRVAPRVALSPSPQAGTTCIELVAPDRRGLLHDVARVLDQFGCTIVAALVDTQGPKAFDAIWVTRGGRALSPREQQELRIRLLSLLEGRM